MIEIINSLIHNTLYITIIFVIVAAIVAMFVRGRKKDKCLNDFAKSMVTIENTSGKMIWGKLTVENTGMELIYDKPHKDEQGHVETSYILYKQEYSNIHAVIRYHEYLSEEAKKKRQLELDKTYHPGFFSRLKRKTLNLFKTVRDSVMEIMNLLISQAKKATPAGSLLSSQDKYVSQMKQELIGSVGNSYEPLLEKHIGRLVVLELIKGDKVIEYPGVLKDYTAEFIEIMDVDYKTDDNAPPKKVDILVPRKHGLIRHLAE